MIRAPFASILAASRDRINQRVEQARRRHPRLDLAALADFLRTEVDGVVAAVAATAPERVAPVALAACDIALELVAREWVGPAARNPAPGRVWLELAPRLARLVAMRPAEVLGMLSNAALYLASTAGARPQQWLDEMAALAPLAQSPPQLRALGQVLAWRAGAAHLRAGAILAADQLPEPLACAAVGAPAAQSWPALRGRLLADPWWRAGAADDDAAAGREVGEFTGFGGQFAAPPLVRACPDGFFVDSGERHRLLIADAHGATLHPAERREFEQAERHRFAPAAAVDGDAIVIKGRRIALDLPVERLAVCCNAHTAAVTSPYTHAIRLLPLR